jgi:hypothetical protein
MRIIKLFTGLAGLGAVLVAVPLFTVGVGLLAWAGAGPEAGLPAVSLSTSGRAVVADDIEPFAGDRQRFMPRPAEAVVSAHDNDHELFIGVGPERSVEAFLSGPDTRPADQDFWVATSQGTSARLDWEIDAGRWSAVVMNADGSAGVDAVVQAQVPAAPVRLAGAIVGVVGLGIGIVGGVLVAAAWGGGRRARSPGLTPARA